jgi:hypothetical protein
MTIQVRRWIKPGERAVLEMPYSEVCMHMRIAGQYKQVELVYVHGRNACYMAKIYNAEGQHISEITPAEAGLFYDRTENRHYVLVPVGAQTHLEKA